MKVWACGDNADSHIWSLSLLWLSLAVQFWPVALPSEPFPSLPPPSLLFLSSGPALECLLLSQTFAPVTLDLGTTVAPPS